MASVNNKKTKIAFLGTPEFAATILEFIAKKPEFEIVSVITQADKPVGRKNILTPPPVKIAAARLNFEIYQPKNSLELEEMLGKMETDLLLVIGFGMILTKKSLESPKVASINVHASLLPKYRGASPIQEALLQGDGETGVSIMQIEEKLDAGPVYLTKTVKIEEQDDFESLSKKLAETSCEILPNALTDIAKGNLKPRPQQTTALSYCHKIEKNDGKINWEKQTAAQILNMLRAYSLWPGVFTEIKGKKIKILAAEIGEESISPGEIEIKDKTLKIGTSKGYLIPTRVQPEGKNPMNIQDYINGYLKK